MTFNFLILTKLRLCVHNINRRKGLRQQLGLAIVQYAQSSSIQSKMMGSVMRAKDTSTHILSQITHVTNAETSRYSVLV